MKAHLKIGGFRGRSTLSTWLHRILVNVCYDFRRKWRPDRFAAPEDEDRPETPDPHQDDHPLRVALVQALDRLPRRHREIFVMYESVGLRHREIGEILGISESSSKVNLFHARRALRELLRSS